MVKALPISPAKGCCLIRGQLSLRKLPTPQLAGRRALVSGRWHPHRLLGTELQGTEVRNEGVRSSKEVAGYKGFWTKWRWRDGLQNEVRGGLQLSLCVTSGRSLSLFGPVFPSV